MVQHTVRICLIFLSERLRVRRGSSPLTFTLEGEGRGGEGRGREGKGGKQTLRLSSQTLLHSIEARYLSYVLQLHLARLDLFEALPRF